MKKICNLAIFVASLSLSTGLFAKENAVIEINHHEAKELIKLPGIGKKKAETIIAYSKKNCIDTKSELMTIKGIGKKTIEHIEQKGFKLIFNCTKAQP